ncbi:protein PIN-LIKES 3-like [Chenopodium quinoa]|uniref:protein PIN-LIKES 3-like n=1 Tax=Chenopodium quinoa TaxID=63459 RepID=UPI000B7856ED|nr:protein PIN-LIKES 3-like [Chenopodium quinoa]
MSGIINLLVMASMPIAKVLLLAAIGSFLGLDRVNILGEDARHHLNQVVFYVFNPALLASTLAKTITFESFLTLWFMPVNIFITYLIGSILGWVLIKVTKAPRHLKGLIIGACSAGNLGKLPLIIVPAMCREKGSPFGDVDVCQSYGLAYASLSMALGNFYIWSYTYNIIRISSREIVDVDANHSEVGDETYGKNTEFLLKPADYSLMTPNNKIPMSLKFQQMLSTFSGKINLKPLFSPSTIGVIVGFMIGLIPPLRKLLIGNDAPLHVIEDSAYLLGDAAIPTITLILGANLLLGLKGSIIQFRIVIGIVAIRYILLPLLGILIIRGAIRGGILKCDPLFQFILLLQYAVPPAMNISTMTELFGNGQSEYSVILLWTYGLAAVALTLWSTIFLWLVAS